MAQQWIASSVDAAEKDEALRKIFDRMVKYQKKPDKLAFEILEGYHRKLGRVSEKPVIKSIPFYRTMPFRVAAVVVPLFMLAGATWMLFTGPEKPATPTVAMVTVDLPDTLGAQSRIDLHDGSDVFLRPGSTISYAEDFNEGDKRRVKIDGEVYFDVAKDSLRPFVVEAGRLNVNVLGTTFNVEGGADKERTVVTLYTGQVKIDGLDADGTMVIPMGPGQRLVYDNATGKYTIEQVAALLPDWIMQRLTFRDTSYEEIFRTIEWFYGVKVETEGKFSDEKLTFRFNGKEDIKTAMWLFQSVSKEFTYQITDNVVTVKGQI